MTVLLGALSPDAYESPPVPVWPMYMMLAGLALENLLKGIQIARDPRLVLPSPSKRTALLASTLTRHLDLNLVRDARVRLSPEEADLVERRSVFVVWGGRYPVPKDALAMKGVPAPDGSTRAPATSYGSDPETMDRLFARLRAELWQQAEARRAADSAEDMRRRKARRRELLRELQGEAYERVESEDVVQFHVRGSSPAALDEPGAAMVCGGCRANFMLNVARPAALCKCKILYHATLYFDGALGRELPNVEKYPPEGKPPTSQPAHQGSTES